MKSVTILPSGVLQYFIIQILSQTQNPWYEHIVNNLFTAYWQNYVARLKKKIPN